MNIVAEMLLTNPAPAAIWATLMLLTIPALLLLGSPIGLHDPLRAARAWLTALRRRDERRQEHLAEAARAVTYAEEIGVAADRAEAGAQRWQQRWEHSEDELTAAWQAWLDADARLRTALAAAGWGTPGTARTCEEYAVRERYLHRSLMQAVGRGEVPATVMADARAGRNGWDARLHPAEQDLVIARASAGWLRRRYEQAVAAEQAARHDAERAHRAARSLRREAGLAAYGLHQGAPLTRAGVTAEGEPQPAAGRTREPASAPPSLAPPATASSI